VQIIVDQPVSTAPAAGSPDDASGPATIDTARQNAPRLVEAYLARHAPDGPFALGAARARFESMDVSRARQASPGHFVVPMVFRAESGAAVSAEAAIDLSGDEWIVESIRRAA